MTTMTTTYACKTYKEYGKDVSIRIVQGESKRFSLDYIVLTKGEYKKIYACHGGLVKVLKDLLHSPEEEEAFFRMINHICREGKPLTDGFYQTLGLVEEGYPLAAKAVQACGEYYLFHTGKNQIDKFLALAEDLGF